MSDIQNAREWAQAELARPESEQQDPGRIAAARLLLSFTEPRPVTEIEHMPPLSGATGPNGEEVVVLSWHNDPGAQLTALINDGTGVWKYWPARNPEGFKSNLERYELRRL